MQKKMNRMINWTAAFVAAALISPLATAAPTAQEVIDKFIDASGGREKIESAKSVVKKGKLIITQMGMEMALESTNSGSNFVNKITVEGMGEMIQAVTDGTVWQLNPMEGDMILKGEQANAVLQQADIVPFLNWKNYYASADVIGEEDGNYKVDFIGKGGGQGAIVFFEKESGMLVRTDSALPDGTPTSLVHSEYKEVDGITFSFNGLIEGAFELQLDSITVNADVDASIFDVPEVIAAQMPETGITAAQLIETMDLDGDGKVGKDEAPEQMQQNFALIDMNGDDSIDVEEMELVATFINGQQ